MYDLELVKQKERERRIHEYISVLLFGLTLVLLMLTWAYPTVRP